MSIDLKWKTEHPRFDLHISCLSGLIDHIVSVSHLLTDSVRLSGEVVLFSILLPVKRSSGKRWICVLLATGKHADAVARDLGIVGTCGSLQGKWYNPVAHSALPTCLSVCLSCCLFAHLSVCLPACLSVWLPFCLHICLSFSLSACLSVCLCLPVCLPICLFLSVCLHICLCLSLWLSVFVCSL